MKFTPQSPLAVLCLFFSIVTLISCSKDSDLLADYVALDPDIGTIAKFVANDTFQISIISNSEDDTFEITVNSESGGTENSGSGGTTVNDTYQTSSSASIVLDVLANDTFNKIEEVTISETSQPDNGDVVINADNTLTYTPFTVEATEETFTYTTEFVNEAGTVSKETGNVTMTINEDPNKGAQDMGELKAFPGAEGFGKNATGGRGGIVYHVTNLNDSGPGSLRKGMQEIQGARTIVFDVSGQINLKQGIYTFPSFGTGINENKLTIAGETAPGDGITIANYGITIRNGNVIIRHLRIRPGSNNGAELPDCISILPLDGDYARDIIIDHCSLSWSQDENIGLEGQPNNPLSNVTIQNCIISESLNSYGVLVGRNVRNLSMLNNLFANTGNRSPEHTYGDGSTFEFNNNLIYNYQRAVTIPYGVGKFDAINNKFKVKAQPPTYNYYYARNNIENPTGQPDDGVIHQSGGITEGKPYGEMSTNWASWNQPSPTMSSLYTPTPASGLEAKLLGHIGANYTTNGVLFDDPVDNRILLDYENLTGSFITNESSVGGFPNLTSMTRPEDYDIDRDGMADSWEMAQGLNPNDSEDGNSDRNDDGYTNLEEFLYSLVQ